MCPCLLLLLTGCGSLLGVGEYAQRQDYPVLQAREQVAVRENPSELRVMTWNIKFGGARIDFWFDGWGDRVHMSEAEVRRNMSALLQLIKDLDPDILLTQEVDIASERSAWLDEVDFILNRGDFNYAAWVPVWEADYIPDQGLGSMKMGQALFSKYPITRNTRIDLGPISNQDTLTRTFYLDRCIQRVEVDLGLRTLTVLNNHPEAYATDGTIQRQIGQILAESETVSGDILTGGDFNAVPPGTLNTSDFADNPVGLDARGVDVVTYEDQPDDLMLPFYQEYNAAIPLDDYQRDTLEAQEPYFSHSIYREVFWNRTLDYLFANGEWSQGITLQRPGQGSDLDPMHLSDHAPLFGIMELL